MKNFKFTVLGFGLMLMAASCKKYDVQEAQAPAAPLVSNTTPAKWSSISSWSSSTSGNTTTHFSKVADSSITAAVAKSGLVLVFKKDGSGIQSLPFEEKESKAYWYYQVSNGSVRINSDNNKGQNLAQQSFTYFVITPEKLAALEASGKSRFELLNLNFEQAGALLK